MPALEDPDQLRKPAESAETPPSQGGGEPAWNPVRPFGWDLPDSPENTPPPASRFRLRKPPRQSPTPPTAQPRTPVKAPLQRLSFNASQPALAPAGDRAGFAMRATLVFLFLRFSFIHDFVTVHIHMNSYLLTIAGFFAYFGLFSASAWRAASESKLFWPWIFFTGLVFLGVPFSFWPGGSLPIVTEFVKNDLMCIPLIAGYFTTWPRLRTLLFVIAMAGATLVALSFVDPDFSTGRLGLNFTSTIGNPNDLGAHFLFVLPFMLFVSFAKSYKFVFRIVCFAGVLGALFEILRTGSRGAFIGMLVGLTIAFLLGNMRARSTLLLLGPIAAVALVAIAPQSMINRMTSLSDQSNGTEASASFEARRVLLEKSINITLHHPLLGVGAGQFSSYEGATADAEGHHHANWQETHNTYSEVSSEAGIPAFIFFMWGVFGTLFVFYRACKLLRRMPGWNEAALASYLVMAGMTGFCACIFFLSFSYRPYFVVLTAIALVLQKLMVEAGIQSSPASARVQPAPVTAGPRQLVQARTPLARHP